MVIVKTVLTRIISIVHVNSLFANRDNSLSHEEDWQHPLLSMKGWLGWDLVSPLACWRVFPLSLLGGAVGGRGCILSGMREPLFVFKTMYRWSYWFHKWKSASCFRNNVCAFKTKHRVYWLHAPQPCKFAIPVFPLVSCMLSSNTLWLHAFAKCY